MAEDEDDEDEDASRYELRSKKRSDKNKPTWNDIANDALSPSPAANQGNNQDTATQDTPLDGPGANRATKKQLPDTTEVAVESSVSNETNQDPPASRSGITVDEFGVIKD